MFSMWNYIKNFFTKGDERSLKAKKNTLLMFFIQGANMLIGLLLVPLTLDYVDSTTYGIWLTLSSMILWIRVLDIGINNGLKNKLAQAFAQNDAVSAKKFVSTTYAMLALIFIPIMLILLLLVPIVDWSQLLRLPNVDVTGLSVSIGIVITYFCLNFILSTINIVLIADQSPAGANLRNLILQIVSIIIIFILTKTTKGSLVNLCIGLCLSPLVVVTFYNITLFSGKYRNIRPDFRSVDFKVAPSLLSLGAKFFIIQICFIVQYQISNFLILRYYGADDVTSYNIAFKYFNALHSIWLTIITPIWAATTDAVTKGENVWVCNVIKKYTRLFGLFSIIFIVMLLIATPVYHLWIGEKVLIPNSFSFWIMLYNIVICYGAIYINVLNGAGVLKVQTITSIFAPIIFLVSFFLLYKCGVGVISIPIAGILSSFNGLVFAPLQCYLIFIKGRKGNGVLYK